MDARLLGWFPGAPACRLVSGGAVRHCLAGEEGSALRVVLKGMRHLVIAMSLRRYLQKLLSHSRRLRFALYVAAIRNGPAVGASRAQE